MGINVDLNKIAKPTVSGQQQTLSVSKAVDNTIPMVETKTLTDEETKIMIFAGYDPNNVESIQQWNQLPQADKERLTSNYYSSLENNTNKVSVDNLVIDESPETVEFVKNFLSKPKEEQKTILKDLITSSEGWNNLSKIQQKRLDKFIDKRICNKDGSINSENASKLLIEIALANENIKYEKEQTNNNVNIYAAIISVDHQIECSEGAPFNKLITFSDFYATSEETSSEPSYFTKMSEDFASRTNSLENFLRSLETSMNPEDYKELMKTIDIDKLSCAASFQKISNSYFDFIRKNPDVLKRNPILTENKTLNQIYLNDIEQRIKNGEQVSDFEEQQVESLKELTNAEKTIGVIGNEEVDERDSVYHSKELRKIIHEKDTSVSEKAEKIATKIKEDVQNDVNFPDEQSKKKEYARRLQQASVDLAHHKRSDLAIALHTQYADFVAENEIPFTEVGTGTEKEAILQAAKNTGSTQIKTAAKIDKTYVDKVNENPNDEKAKNGLTMTLEGTAKRADAQKVQEITNGMVANDENISDQTKEIYAEYSIATCTTPEMRDQQKASLESYNLDSFNKGVEKGLATVAQLESTSASTQTATRSTDTSYTPSTTQATTTNYQTNPITSKSVESINNSTENAKTVYQELITGETSIHQLAESFNNLTSTEKKDILKALRPSDLVKMPIAICALCPEFIPQFVSAGKGIDIIKNVPDAASDTIRCMKKSNDNDVKNELYSFMLEYPAQFMKISVQEAKEKMGIKDDDQPRNHILFRA